MTVTNTGIYGTGVGSYIEIILRTFAENTPIIHSTIMDKIFETNSSFHVK